MQAINRKDHVSNLALPRTILSNDAKRNDNRNETNTVIRQLPLRPKADASDESRPFLNDK